MWKNVWFCNVDNDKNIVPGTGKYSLGHLKCGWWLGRLGARCLGIIMSPPPPSKLPGKGFGFLTSLTSFMTSLYCAVLSACLCSSSAIRSLNLRGLLFPAILETVGEADEDVFRLTYSHWPLFYALLLTTNVEIVVFITLCVFVDKPVNFESSWFCPEQTQLSHNPFVLI